MSHTDATAEYHRLCSSIHALDELQAQYHRAGDAARRRAVQAAIAPLLARTHELLEFI